MKISEDASKMTIEEKLAHAFLYVTWSDAFVNQATLLLKKAKKSDLFDVVPYDYLDDCIEPATKLLKECLIVGDKMTDNPKENAKARKEFSKNLNDTLSKAFSIDKEEVVGWAWAFLCESLLALYIAEYFSPDLTDELAEPIRDLEAATKEIFGVKSASGDASHLIELETVVDEITIK